MGLGGRDQLRRKRANVSGPEPRCAAAECAPCRPRPAAQGGTKVLSRLPLWACFWSCQVFGPRGWDTGRLAWVGQRAAAEPGWLGAGGTLVRACPSWGAFLACRPAPSPHPANGAQSGAGWVEGGALAQQLQPSSRWPQTFTKRCVRTHQSPLIIVGWAAGGGRVGPLGTGSAEGAGGLRSGRREEVKRNLKKMDESGGRHPQPARSPAPSLLMRGRERGTGATLR